MVPIYNPGLFAGVPELALLDWFLGLALSMFTALLPVIIAMMITQRS